MPREDNGADCRDLDAVLQNAVFAAGQPGEVADYLRVGCSLEAAFQLPGGRNAAGIVARYRQDRLAALTRYLQYWRQYCLDLQLLRSLLLCLKPHLSPQLMSRRLSGSKQDAIDLLSYEVQHELVHFRELESVTSTIQEAFRVASHVISLVNLFDVYYMRHDDFHADNFPQLPEIDPTGAYCYHLEVSTSSFKQASVKLRAEPVTQANVLDLYTEIKAWEQLSKEGFDCIAQLHGTVTLRGRMAFVFEACDGRLSDLIRDDRSLVPHFQKRPAARLRALQQLCRFARKLFSATFFLHRRRFVHRDLTTATILYSHSDWTYDLKLCNFTVSGTNTDVFDTITNFSWYFTTMYGERLRLTPALDMCNIGLVLWELYYGAASEPQPLRKGDCLVPNIEDFDGPPALRDLIRRCTSREDGLRPTESDEAEILDILRRHEVLGVIRKPSDAS